MECSVVFNHGENSHTLPVLSLSAGGMYVAVNERVDHELARGTTLKNIQFSLDGLDVVTLNGFVAHRMSLGEIGGCGIEFSESSNTDIHLLERFVEAKLEEFGLASI